MESKVVQHMALPLHIQRLESVLNLGPYLLEIEKDFNQTAHFVTIDEDDAIATTQDESLLTHVSKTPPFRNRLNFSRLTPERQWIKDLLLSETDDSDDGELSDAEKAKLMLEIQYKRQHHWKKRKKKINKLTGYQYYSAGLLLPVDKYPDIKRKSIVTTNGLSVTSGASRKAGAKPKQKKHSDEQKKATPTPDPAISKTPLSDEEPVVLREVHAKEREQYRKKLWSFIVKKEIPRMAKQFSQSRHVTLTNNKKVAQLCQKEVRKLALKSQKLSKESNSVQPRARRIMKEVLVFWRKYERVEKEARKKAEKEAQEQQKLYEEMREARRQQRKLNFLITQTELYAHFMSKKITDDTSTEEILSSLDSKPMEGAVPLAVRNKIEETDDYDSAGMKEAVLNNVMNAVEKHKAKHKTFVDSSLVNGVTTDLQQSFDDKFSLANPAISAEDEVSQASIFNGQLKAYQIKGMSWLATLYDQGINGILADEMGLGKTVQSIALLAHLAEHQNIWGPFLIVSPASTLHNWQQECTRFVPVFKVLPYWGSPHERKVIRKYWNQKLLCSRNSPFHVLITSYQLVVQDFKYFQRIKWQYMILDEAQAIKSSSSVRWKMLMSFNCRNRLLLTGTPIQNTMAELWALLHFIMPTMFDSHDEFSEWFSKDIESHAEKKSALDENQLTRLHMILKPFMLRRIKKDVEHEMAEKIEVHLSCGLSTRQKELYRRLRGRISIDDLLHSSTSNHSSKDSTSTLMNLVMQFRKVCNHPDLFECRDVLSPLTNYSISTYSVPCIVYNDIVHPSSLLEVNRTISSTLTVVSSDYAHKSSLDSGTHLWAFLRHTLLSPSEAASIHSGSTVERLQVITELAQALQLLYLRRLWSTSDHNASHHHLLSVSQDHLLSHQSINSSSLLRPLVFTSHTSRFYSHLDYIVYPIKYRVVHKLDVIHSTGDEQIITDNNTTVMDSAIPGMRTFNHTPSDIPKMLITIMPKVLARPITIYASNRGAEYARTIMETGGPLPFKSIMLNGCDHYQSSLYPSIQPQEERGLRASRPLKGWSDIHIPTKENMVIDSGKMSVLDKLLTRLKREGHRVLLYSQMTRMIDILEDYMAYRRHKYIRLDGSSRICDRRDMVEDFQTRSDIFVFILSTRAGGLGINLTAADTVIFYDSDWNPTVDQQAMDRAHRLGQTKQVTVYRLIVKGSIEERILQRANEKSEIQKMVISGGDYKSDTLKPKEVVSLLLDDEEMETRFLAKQAEKKVQEEQTRMKTSKTRKRKLVQKARDGNTSTPPAAKRSNHSLSTSPSHGPDHSVNSAHISSSNGGGDHMNGGDFIDIVGYTPTNNHFDKSPTTKLGKRQPTKRTKNSLVENKRAKKGPPPAPSNNSYPSPSNSFPNSPLSVSSSALNVDLNHASSPRASPLSFSGGPSISTTTPPRKYSKKAPSKKQNKSIHH